MIKHTAVFMFCNRENNSRISDIASVLSTKTLDFDDERNLDTLFVPYKVEKGEMQYERIR